MEEGRKEDGAGGRGNVWPWIICCHTGELQFGVPCPDLRVLTFVSVSGNQTNLLMNRSDIEMKNYYIFLQNICPKVFKCFVTRLMWAVFRRETC
jgi:hypothetical protein